MNHWIKAFISLLLLVSTLSSLFAGSRTVVLQVNESFPIWSDKLPHGGMGSEIIQAISKAANIKTRIEFIPLKRLIADTTNNDIGNPLFYMQNQEFAAIIPIAVSYDAFFSYKKSVESLLQKSQVSPINIGVLKGTKQNISSQFAHFEESTSHRSLFKKLKAERIDLVVELDLVGRSIIQKDKAFRSTIIERSGSPVAILLDINYPEASEIALAYKKGLELILKNGTYQKILSKYYKNGTEPQQWYRDLSKFSMLYGADQMGDFR